MQLNNNEILCPECGKLIALFEKPTNPRRLVGACSCGGRLREVIELDNINYLSEEDILEPAEPASSVMTAGTTTETSSFTQPADKRKRRK